MQGHPPHHRKASHEPKPQPRTRPHRRGNTEGIFRLLIIAAITGILAAALLLSFLEAGQSF